MVHNVGERCCLLGKLAISGARAGVGWQGAAPRPQATCSAATAWPACECELASLSCGPAALLAL